jgi:hypothetical protein
MPCPERILRSYAKAAFWIATAEIASVRDDPTEPGVRLIQLRSVVPLKGVPRDVDRELSMVSYSGVSEQKGALNRVASLAKPGNKVILLDVGAFFSQMVRARRFQRAKKIFGRFNMKLMDVLIQGSKALAARSGRQ